MKAFIEIVIFQLWIRGSEIKIFHRILKNKWDKKLDFIPKIFPKKRLSKHEKFIKTFF